MLKTAMIYKDVFSRLKHREPTKYPTVNLYFKNICAIRLTIYDWLSSEQEEVQATNRTTTTLRMQTKFEKYWDTMHGLMGVASSLDPRYKMKQIEFLCPLIYPNNATQEIKKYKDILYELVKDISQNLNKVNRCNLNL
ncbi:unnamed protein product [Prunus brigantina]